MSEASSKLGQATFTKGSATGPTRRRNKKSELFELEKKLQEYPKGIKQSLLKALNNLLQLGWNEDVPLMLDGTPFQIQVWKLLLTVPRGETWTYQELANHLGRPSATRAVANACGANKIAYFIPCHRIIRSDGGLGGYRWGIELKRRLLDVEKSQLDLGSPDPNQKHSRLELCFLPKVSASDSI